MDTKTYYIYNLEVYAGKQPERPYNMSNKPADVVKRMCESLYGSGQNITTDNWFTNLNLVKELKEKALICKNHQKE